MQLAPQVEYQSVGTAEVCVVPVYPLSKPPFATKSSPRIGAGKRQQTNIMPPSKGHKVAGLFLLPLPPDLLRPKISRKTPRFSDDTAETVSAHNKMSAHHHTNRAPWERPAV